ncbi:sigma-54-dependent transcriptional regulator [Sedimenticola selenatireducens]|uniref:Sigma-54-dependent Fis family transcriptional regulator n=1 Tax=Sedimenticola selenatireducens TaxID=191960 RepID=A0A558DTS3_9GAMM|nr:sigma-54 dependent transcriptional regulator [Sedimenticola selenatireducens]TVO76973.1 sigma-54-dependent Fis family transcriptional regulator [Sedimenticola selenatireducens]TVT64416.1 MAG: sigma-54-dependent Fis family transcriptional regulator [Sedimenticola selenatireducens]
MTHRLLIIEDDDSLNQILQLHFEEQGFMVEGVNRCDQGLDKIKQAAYDLLLLDQQLPDGNGIDLLQKIKDESLDQTVIMMTGQHDLELAIEAIKLGAADFIHKPIKISELQHVVDRVLENQRLSRAVKALKPDDQEPKAHQELIGRGEAMLQVSKEIALSAGSNATVMITGESGTGKEVVARLIHNHSGVTGPFVAINCAAIVDTLLESELFGHEKGAFTGATERKQGKFELAQDGTLFLDEIGELAAPLQAKLLRVLQEQTLERVGGSQQIKTNARIIAATNRDLFKEAAEGRFREDLAYRLKVVSIHLPPLRERLEDIPLLADALISRIARKIHKPAAQLTDATLAALKRYQWPGNVRELENLLTQALVHARGNVLTPDLLLFRQPVNSTQESANTTPNSSLVERTLDQVEAEHIQRVLDYTHGHKGKSCDILAISRPALDRKIKKYDLILP